MASAFTHHRAEVAAAALSVLALLTGAAQPDTATPSEPRSVAVTIYSDGFAMVKDTREVVLTRGLNRLALRGVSASMQPETALLRSVSHPGSFTLVEQNFDFALLTPESLVAQSVGRTVEWTSTPTTTGAERRETAVLLSAQQGMVLQTRQGTEWGQGGRLSMAELPPTLHERATLTSALDSRRAGPQSLELSYLSSGLLWQAHYVAELSPDERTLDLAGWATLTNESGTGYDNARLQLVAGRVNRVREPRPAKDGVQYVEVTGTRVANEALFEYQLYTLPAPTTLADQQVKQVALFDRVSDVPVRKQLVVESLSWRGDAPQELDADVYFFVENRAAHHLGMPLPAGRVFIRKRQADGSLVHLGEASAGHTPVNETLRLRLSSALGDEVNSGLGVSGEARQTDFVRHESRDGEDRYESAHAVTLRNAWHHPLTLTLRMPMKGDWTMLQESLPHSRPSAKFAEWQLTLPPEGETTLTYRVQVR